MKVDTERILKLAATLTPRNVFDQSIGIDENCFSPRKIVDLIRTGATGDDLFHLRNCPTCTENIVGYARVEQNLALGGFPTVGPQGVFAAFAKQVERPYPVVLGLHSRSFYIGNDPKTERILLICNLFPVINLGESGKVIQASLHVEGAIISKKGAIKSKSDITEDGKINCLEVSFTGGRLSHRVQDALVRGQRVIDTIRIHGCFKDGRREAFVGQAIVEFMPYAW
jgi:hypothetical protein